MGEIKDKLKGKVKQLEGKLTGDRVRQAQGKVEETKGKIEGAFSRTKARVNTRINEARMKRAVKRAAR